MNLKQLHKLRLPLAFIIGFTFSLFVNAQDKEDAKKQIDSMSLKMFTDMNNRDYDAIMSMTHPKVFELVPKETMVTIFKSTFEGNETFSVDLPKEIPDYKVSDIFLDEENSTDYAFVSYDMSMSMTFNNEEFDDEMKENMVKMMKLQGMEAEFISDKTVKINMLNRITILLNDESTNHKWAMLNYDPNSPLFFQLLSAEIIENAKEYHQDLMLENKKKE
ncbi:hypothetical protein FBALC1_08153 [Flavobacteriales bacterium ALC-1]|nr:hypothetical protein FBALC1_08153 [Flavobacteriales bacterium ALC-1]